MKTQNSISKKLYMVPAMSTFYIHNQQSLLAGSIQDANATENETDLGIGYGGGGSGPAF